MLVAVWMTCLRAEGLSSSTHLQRHEVGGQWSSFAKALVAPGRVAELLLFSFRVGRGV